MFEGLEEGDPQMEERVTGLQPLRGAAWREWEKKERKSDVNTLR